MEIIKNQIINIKVVDSAANLPGSPLTPDTGILGQIINFIANNLLIIGLVCLAVLVIVAIILVLAKLSKNHQTRGIRRSLLISIPVITLSLLAISPMVVGFTKADAATSEKATLVIDKSKDLTAKTTATITPNQINTDYAEISAKLNNDLDGIIGKDMFIALQPIELLDSSFLDLTTNDQPLFQVDNKRHPSNVNFDVRVAVNDSLPTGDYAADINYYVKTLEPTYCGTLDYECIIYTIDTADGAYTIPTGGHVTGSVDHIYDWDVYVDDVLTTDCSGGNCVGVSNTLADGIHLTGLNKGQHQIRIIPHDNSAPGWGNAFGYYDLYSGPDDYANRQKIVSIDAPLTTMAFAPKTTESTTNASHMFAGIFYGCSGLGAPAIIIDTYKLPSTITDLSYFLDHAYSDNYKLTSPIDLGQISGWLDNNQSIKDLSFFLSSIHANNQQLATPIDLTPIAGWFNHNNSIQDLSLFLYDAHMYDTNLTSPIDLSPIADWFSGNNSITDLSDFLSNIHSGKTQIASPIDLSPIADWFSGNTSVVDLSGFLYGVHLDNDNLINPIDLAPIAGWFNHNNSITDLSNFLANTHRGNTKLTATISLAPISNWFHNNTSITNLSSLFYHTYYGNTQLTAPIDLVPISGWFSNNTSITDLSGFLELTHYGNSQLTDPINLLPTAGWFGVNTSFASLSSFLHGTHYNNSQLKLAGQVILPNWIQTAREGSDSILDTSYTFRETFYRASSSASDTDEVKFADGTVLSSLGQPSSNLKTYTNRSGITPLNANWK